jgi:succinate dehydrogenase/fumarate reductase cytochrome b subunit
VSFKLLGREYYQGSFSEPWLLFAPLGIHVTAGITKRLLSPNPIPRHPSLLTLTAYPMLFFLPVHVLTHRIIPSDPSPPISALSPSELNFEFVKAGLAGWPVRSSLLYAGLVICGLVHVFEGWHVIMGTWGIGKGLGKKARRICVGLGIGTVLSGLLFVAKEPMNVLQSTLAQINASYLSSAVFRFNLVRKFGYICCCISLTRTCCRPERVENYVFVSWTFKFSYSTILPCSFAGGYPGALQHHYGC